MPYFNHDTSNEARINCTSSSVLHVFFTSHIQVLPSLYHSNTRGAPPIRAAMSSRLQPTFAPSTQTRLNAGLPCPLHVRAILRRLEAGGAPHTHTRVEKGKWKLAIWILKQGLRRANGSERDLQLTTPLALHNWLVYSLAYTVHTAPLSESVCV